MGIFKRKTRTVSQKSDVPSIRTLWPSLGEDLCDECPQVATVRVLVPHVVYVLDFCSHHFRKHQKEFTEKGYMWIDGRHESHKFTSTHKDIHAERVISS